MAYHLFCTILTLAFTEKFFMVESKEANACFYNATVNVSNRQKCLDEVKYLASDSSLYWFGERWRTTCSVRLHQANTVERFTHFVNFTVKNFIIYFSDQLL